MSVNELVAGFHARLDKISRLNLNEELKGHLLLRQAKLNSQAWNIIVGSAGGDFSLQLLSASFRNAYRSEDLRPASTAKRAYNSSTCATRIRTKSPPKSQRVQPQNGFRNKNEPSNYTLFCTFMNQDHHAEKPSATVNSEARASIAGNRTLDSVLEKVNTKEIDDDVACRHKHHFDLYVFPKKTLFAVPMPFTCKVGRSSKPVSFKIKFDVIE